MGALIGAAFELVFVEVNAGPLPPGFEIAPRVLGAAW
jgi:hypothetical protein